MFLFLIAIVNGSTGLDKIQKISEKRAMPNGHTGPATQAISLATTSRKNKKEFLCIFCRSRAKLVRGGAVVRHRGMGVTLVTSYILECEE